MNATSRGDAATAANYAVLPAPLQAEVDFYARIAQLSDQIIEGKHPIIKLPPGPLNNFTKQRTLVLQTLSTKLGFKPQISYGAGMYIDHSASKSESNTATIAPVSRTNPYHLENAEFAPRRQRIEQELQIQVDKKKAHVRDREFFLDSPQRFDPQEIYAQAVRIVNPVSGLHISSRNYSTTSGSFDENLFYSSKANSCSPEEGECQAGDTRQGRQDFRSYEARNNNQAPDLYTLNTGEISVDGNGAHDARIQTQTPAYQVSNKKPSHPSNLVKQHAPRGSIRPTNTQDIEDTRDESYSPPAADAFKTFPPQDSSDLAGVVENQPTVMLPEASNRRSHVPLANNAGKLSTASLLSTAPPVLASSDSVSFAPPQARVSPIEMPRVREGRDASRILHDAPSPSATRLRDSRDSRLVGQPSSRETAQEGISLSRQSSYNPRKRRREHGVVEQPRRAPSKRLARSPAQSPQLVVKPEPISPQPLSNELPRRLILRDDGHAEIEVVAQTRPSDEGLSNYSTVPSFYSTNPSYAYQQDASLYSFRIPSEFTHGEHQYSIPRYAPSEAFRAVSPSPILAPRHNDQDFRRVATLPATLRAESPAPAPRRIMSPPAIHAVRHYPPHPQTRYSPVEATSVRTLARQQSVMPSQGSGAMRPYHRPQQHVQYSSAQPQRDAPRFLTERGFMAPPPPSSARRVVVDQYGNEYIAVPTATRSRYSIAPEDQYVSQRASSYQPRSITRDRLSSMVEPSYEYATF